MYLPCPDGGQKLYIMTKASILRAWMKSSNMNLTVHLEFREKMIAKTVINSGCTMIINATPELFENNIPLHEDEDDSEVVEEHQPVDVPAIEINPDEIPVAEVKDAPNPKVEPEKDDF